MFQRNPKGDPNEPVLSFNHAILKVRWAGQHINNLAPAVATFLDQQRAAGLLQIDGKTTHLGATGGNIPAYIPLLAGDAIFNLRSALDCCWMGLKRSVNANASKGTLPRAATREDLIQSLKNASMERAIPGSDKLIIDSVAAYEGGNDVLWLGGQVDNWNKHNMLPLTQRRVNISNATFNNGAGGSINFKDVIIEGDHPFGIFSFSETGLQQQSADFSTELMLDILQSGRQVELMPFLENLKLETVKVVKVFTAEYAASHEIYAWG